ncbi:hypothetical protein PspLS_01331 [Pyricularia sp. CBS 133598]|nr:hypothetical protein PspLS_01331 [Pyricularia sp. CBS 133598]
MMLWRKPPNVAGTSANALFALLLVASGGCLFGHDTGVINGVLAMPSFRDQFNPSTSQSSLIVAILSAGTFLGSLISAPMADFIGRRKALHIAIGVFCLGVVFQVCSADIPMLLGGRFVAGIGVGLISVLVPLYQSEMAPKWIRGTMVCAYQLFITLGLLAASVINIITSDIPGPVAYRIPLGLQLVWACVLMMGLLILPETPRYLIKRGLDTEAALSLSRLRRLDITHPALIEELAEIKANHEYELALGPDTYKDVFFGSPHLGRRTLTACGLQMLQQLSGVNFIMYYGTWFFKGAMVDNPYLISCIMNIVNFISTLPGLVVVESWGRRRLLIVGAIGMSICQLSVASFTAATKHIAGSNGSSTLQNQVLVTFVAIYIFFFAASWGPVVWVVTAEIFPLKVRAKSMSVSTASNWLLNFGIAYSTPYMVDTGYASLGPLIFFVWGAFCIVGIFFVYFMVYETSKISLEQIDEMYERVTVAWKSRDFEPSWSFQQMRDLGYSDSGIPPEESNELQQTTTTQSETASSGMAPSNGDSKSIPTMGNVDFSY